ncbi:hypothetical protein AWC38_SpisGene20739 [Stylophora pistillata]|uniref:Uncharacterized protein n=1 Tax=Stylophora pistillata TaxID=50429 RepID=A0A2B4RFM6_STYPI|nr:hypothetical protein AWC38_SpisGene20739 [Stylophora pistillata]
MAFFVRDNYSVWSEVRQKNKSEKRKRAKSSSPQIIRPLDRDKARFQLLEVLERRDSIECSRLEIDHTRNHALSGSALRKDPSTGITTEELEHQNDETDKLGHLDSGDDSVIAATATEDQKLKYAIVKGIFEAIELGVKNSSWCLPTRCKRDGCKNFLSAADVLQAPTLPDGHRELYCENCCTTFLHRPAFVNGDPRNIAYIGHWDSFQPFGKKSRSNGYQVNYAGSLPDFPPANIIIRHIILLWMGDHPALFEVCKTKGAGGRKGCRSRSQSWFKPVGQPFNVAISKTINSASSCGQESTLKTKKSWITLLGPYGEWLSEESGESINWPKRSLRPSRQRSMALLTSELKLGPDPIEMHLTFPSRLPSSSIP